MKNIIHRPVCPYRLAHILHQQLQISAAHNTAENSFCFFPVSDERQHMNTEIFFIIQSKQRSYATVSDTQKSLEKALRHLVYAIDALTTLYGLAPAGDYDVTFEWDDSVVVDAEKERQRDLQEVREGLMQKWEFRVKWYGETPEVAKRMVASMEESDDEILEFGSNEPEEGEGANRPSENGG